MKKKWAYLLLAVTLDCILPWTGAAQDRWVDEDFVLRNHPLLESRNPSVLQALDRNAFSTVKLSYNKSNGNFVNYHQSDNACLFSAEAHSFYRLNPRIVLRGAIGYEYNYGRDQSGSVLMDPYYNTFDLVEMTDENKGAVKKEKYQVRTDLSYNFWKGWSLGASFDFTSANLSKMKDLRHSNVFSDMKLALGTSYDFKGRWIIGATWLYRKSVEGISFERFSPGDLHYEILVSYGPFWGKRKSFEENMGQISKTRTPVLNIFQGGALQVEFNPNERFGLFLEGNCSYRSCSYGHKSPNTVLYNTFSGLEYAAAVQALFKTADDRHLLRFDISGRPMTSYESIYKTVHHSSGENETQYFDPKEVSRSDSRTYRVMYAAWFRANDSVAQGSLKAGITIWDRSRLTTLYPYYRQERMLPFALYAEGDAHLSWKKNLFVPGLRLTYGGSLGYALAEGSFIPDATQVKPKDAPQMLGREKEFLNAPQLELSPSFRYSRMIRRFALWVEVDYSWLRALAPLEYLAGPDHHSVTLSIGLDF